MLSLLSTVRTVTSGQPAFHRDLRRRVTGVYGAAGEAWLERLPAVIAECAALWDLSVGDPFPGLTYNHVSSATLPDGTHAVLKIGVPEIQQTREAQALRLWDGRGAVRLLRFEARLGALLIERLQPGSPLSDVSDDAVAVPAAAAVMRALWRPAPAAHPFPSVADWARGVDRYIAAFPTAGPYPRDLVEEASQLFAELLATSGPPVVLHGDLHHDNILASARAPWLAIDPKGVVGEPAYEVGALLRNPGSQIESEPDLRGLLSRRIALFSRELDMDPERLRKWGMAQAVLSACWHWEDRDGPPTLAFRVAEALSSG